MRQMPTAIEQAWRSGEFIGSQRAMARVTIVNPALQLHLHDQDIYATLLFGVSAFSFEGPHYRQPVELPNVRSVTWDRNTESDAADCTIQFYNTRPLPLGETPQGADLDQPGYYTYNRGTTGFSGRWGHEENEWKQMIMPDNMIRTFEGYGFDPGKAPENDPHLVQTGVWLIDDVEYTADGMITVRCRDSIRLLQDHIVFPPVNGFRAGFRTPDMPDGAYAYPVSFSSENTEPVVNNVSMKPQRLSASYHSDSNEPYTGHNQPVFGHRGSHAFDGDVQSYWLSIGNARRDAPYAFEWIQARVNGERVREVRFRTRGTGYRVYVCVQDNNGNWVGNRRVPYDPNHPASAPNGSDTAYVTSATVGSEGLQTITLPGNGVANARYVRLTFGNLWNSGMGQFVHRAGVRTFTVFGGPTQRREVRRFEDKNYDDYTDVVKLFCAWGGFFWPILPRHRTELLSDGTERVWNYDRDDPAMTLAAGRVFGDFENTGTAGVFDLTPDIFDKQPLLDGINHVRDIVGFLFYGDEFGGVVWRHPNIFELGNRQFGAGARVREMVTIDETRQLMELTATLSSRNVRERVFVSDTTGKYGGIAAGFNPNWTNMRRVAGWTDQHFASEEECRLMADMITLRQMFQYRTDHVVIPGYPKIQIDDQVRVFERTTSEGFVHYVKGIESNNDLETGQWTYTLNTHWLGERPFERWSFRPEDFHEETQRYLRGLFGEGAGRISYDPGDWGGH